MPFKDYNQKIKYNNLHNPDRVNHFRDNGKNIRLNLRGFKKRLYVCEFCGSIGKTDFHEYSSNPKEVIELCRDCHRFITIGTFNENKLFL